MKKVKGSLLLVLLLGFLGTSAWGSTQWAVPAGFPGTASKVVTDAQGNVYVTGSTYSAVTNPATSTADMLTVKYDASGVKQWEVAYNGPQNGFDTAASLVVDMSGNVYVAGTSYASPAYYTSGWATVVKYSPTGEQLWATRYADSAYGSGSCGIDVDAAGSVYVTLNTIYDYAWSSNAIDGAVVKYDANGIRKWKILLNDYAYGDDFAAKILVKNGFVYASATLDGQDHGYGDNYRNSALWKITLNGQIVWKTRFDGGGADYASDFTVDGQDNVYVASISDRLLPGYGYLMPYAYDYATTKFDANGQQVWSSRYNNDSDNMIDNHQPSSIAVDAAGNVFVTGTSPGSGTGTDIATLKYNGADGTRLWVDRYNGTANGDETGGTVLIDDDGNALVTGTSRNSESDLDFTAIKYTTDGVRQSTSLYGKAAAVNETVSATALDQNGDLLLTGTSSDASGIPQFLTVKIIDTINVPLDIKPGSLSNSINPRNHGVIPVAILSSDAFDATSVDPASLRFGATGIEARPQHFALGDVNGDGKDDLMLQFPTEESGFACGTETGLLTGATSDGQTIKGADAIVTTGCK